MVKLNDLHWEIFKRYWTIIKIQITNKTTFSSNHETYSMITTVEGLKININCNYEPNSLIYKKTDEQRTGIWI